MPNLPTIVPGSSRLYLAEGIAAIIEVKSNLESQWTEVVDKANDVALVTRTFNAPIQFGKVPDPKIPLFVVGYTGWEKWETLDKHLKDAPIAGMLQIDKGQYTSTDKWGRFAALAPWALWGLICNLHSAVSLSLLFPQQPIHYAGIDTKPKKP